MSDDRDCMAVWHGRVAFDEAVDLQMRICALKKEGFPADVLLLLEHPPTITLGRNATAAHLLAAGDELRRRGVGVSHVDRGGDITFHGPGQLVGYPILSLRPGERDVHRYMRNMEESLIRLLEQYGIRSGRDPKFTGVWTSGGKIAAMGVHLSRWITRHGFALNVTTDLSYYGLIVPCGIVGRSVTSMQAELSRAVALEEAAEKYLPAFSSVFGRRVIRTEPSELLEALDAWEAGKNAAARPESSAAPAP